MFTSVLTSLEFEACTRNYNYWAYMQLHAELIPEAPLLSQEQYDSLYAVFETFEM